MKKVFKMKDLDCANCAAKMERAIGKINGVNSASINFMGQRLTIDAEESLFEEIMDAAEKAVKKVDADCAIVR